MQGVVIGRVKLSFNFSRYPGVTGFILLQFLVPIVAFIFAIPLTILSGLSHIVCFVIAVPLAATVLYLDLAEVDTKENDASDAPER